MIVEGIGVEKNRKGLRWWQITLICVGAVVWILFFPVYLGSWLTVVNNEETTTQSPQASATVDAAAVTQTPRPTKKPTPKPTPAPLEITAQELIDAYEENQLSADEKYEDEKMAVTGFVEDIGENIIGQLYVTLNNGEDTSFSVVQCFLDRYNDDSMAKAKKLKIGDKITILGECEGKGTFHVQLSGCTIK